MLPMNEWAPVNDYVKHEEHTSNGRVTEAVEEDILINEEVWIFYGYAT